MIDCYIALGSNIENPQKQIQAALQHIEQVPETRILARSNFYKTKPVGFANQPDFLNGVIKIETVLSANDLLDHLLTIESKQGRIRSEERNGPRTLDLDLLIYGNAIIKTENLTIPHPRMCQRAFVMFPLADIAPDLMLTNDMTVNEISNSLDWDGELVEI